MVAYAAWVTAIGASVTILSRPSKKNPAPRWSFPGPWSIGIVESCVHTEPALRLIVTVEAWTGVVGSASYPSSKWS